MDMAQLRYLITIADEGSFTQAARKLKLSQPSLSLAIKKMEDEVGHPLFDRLTRKVVPTQAGERMLETARRVLADLERTTCEVRDLKGEVTGSLRIGAIPTIGPYLLPDMVQRFHEKFPGVGLHIREDVTSRLIPLLEQGELDVALTSSVPERPGIHMDLLGDEELLLVTSGDSSLAKADKVLWDALEGERFLVLGEEHCLADQVAWFCRKNRVSERTLLEGTQLSTIAAMVKRGLGISLVPSLMKNENNDGIRFLHLDGPPATRPLYVAWSVLRYRTQAAREFALLAHSIVKTKLK